MQPQVLMFTNNSMLGFSSEVKQAELFLGSHLGLSDKPAFTVCASWESGDSRRWRWPRRALGQVLCSHSSRPLQSRGVVGALRNSVCCLPCGSYGSYMDRFLYTSVVVPTLPCAEVPTVSGPPEAGAAQKCSCTHPGAVSELSPWGSLPSMSRGLALGPDVRSQRKAESCSHGNAGSGFQKR